MIRAFAVLAVAMAACSTDAAHSSFEYQLYAGVTRLDAALPEQMPTVYIDDIPTDILTASYDSFGATHRLELRYGTTVIDRFDLTVASACPDLAGPIDSVHDSLCVFPTGELRFAGQHAQADTGSCSADSFCAPRCRTNGCAKGEHCTARITSSAPLATKLACAPYGTAGPGAACTLIDDLDGAYSDCAKDLLCLDGTCTAVVDSGHEVPGYPPELRIATP